MNEELKQKVTAYLDGALPAAEAAAFEREIAKSPELLAELEEQRAVSKLLKDLPREKLPVGFMQRLERRRAGGDARPEPEWVFLAPAYRPFAAALSMRCTAPPPVCPGRGMLRLHRPCSMLVAWRRRFKRRPPHGRRSAWKSAPSHFLRSFSPRSSPS